MLRTQVIVLWLGLFVPVFGQCASPYSLQLNKEATLFAVSAEVGVIAHFTNKNSKRSTADEINALDESDIPAFDRHFAGRWNRDAQKVSDVFLSVGLFSPLPLIYQQRQDLITLSIMYLETVTLASSGMALAKATVTRYRPLAYGDKAPMDEKLGSDTKRSFFSGHATLISSGLVFTATVFSDYFPQSPYKNYVWGAAISGLVTGSVLRVVGGKHFPSDIAVGMAWGSAVGYAVPALHRGTGSAILTPYATRDQLGMMYLKQF